MTKILLPAPVIMSPFAGAVPTGAMGTGVGAASTFSFNGAGDKIAIIFVNASSVPDLISFAVHAVTTAGSAGNIEVTLENVTNGDPSGAVTNSATGSAAINSTGFKTISGIAGTAVLSDNTEYAIVLTAGSGWDRNLAIRLSSGSSGGNQSFPHIKTKDSVGSWTSSTNTNTGLCFGFADSDGVYFRMLGLMGSYLATVENFSSTTNPDERGNRFTLNAPMTCIGAVVMFTGGSAPGANDDVEIKLLSSHTSSPVEQRTVVLEGEATGGAMAKIISFSSGFDCAAGSTYALTLQALGSETQGMLRWEYPSNAHLAGIMGTSFHATTRNDEGNCTDSGNNNFLYGIFPIFSHVDDGTGGGGGGGSETAHGIVGLQSLESGVIA